MKIQSPAIVFSTLLVIFTFDPPKAQADWTNGRKAAAVLGQPDFTSGLPGTSATKLDRPRDVAIDPNTGKVFVADSNNHRVLRFSSMAAAMKGAAAEAVLGQPDLSTGSFAGVVSASTMQLPWGVDVDSEGRLWVSEFAHHRVLRFDDAATKPNGAPADGVLGQPNFTTKNPATTNSGMNRPTGLEVDAFGNLWVADRENHRVLKFSDAKNKGNGASADAVLGQPNFTTANPLSGPAGIDSPLDVATQLTFTPPPVVLPTMILYVADRGNHRVLRFNGAFVLPNGSNADAVLGQANFSDNSAAVGAAALQTPSGVAVDQTALWVAEVTGVKRYENAKDLGNGAPADVVIGQPNFNSVGFETSQTGVAEPQGVAVDRQGDLYVPQTRVIPNEDCHRVTRYSPADPQPDNLVGKRRPLKKQKGDGTYNTSGNGQKIRVRKRGRVAKVHLTIQNDGPFDERYKTRATRGNRKLAIKYIALQSGRKNITGKLVRGKYLAPVEFRKFLRIIARIRANKRVRKTISLVSQSMENGNRDRVKAKVIIRP